MSERNERDEAVAEVVAVVVMAIGGYVTAVLFLGGM